MAPRENAPFSRGLTVQINVRLLLSAASVVVPFLGGSARADALAKLQPEKLAAVRRDVQALRQQERKLSRPGPYQEYRSNLHVHSALSHDTRGTIEEIVAAAKAAGTRGLMFTEPPAGHYDYFKDGHQGTKDGVLLIPGAETKGFLVYPTQSLHGLEAGSAQEFADLVR